MDLNAAGLLREENGLHKLQNVGVSSSSDVFSDAERDVVALQRVPDELQVDARKIRGLQSPTMVNTRPLHMKRGPGRSWSRPFQ